MINKILALCLIALSYINASSKPFTEETEEAEIIHCHNTAANCNIITILRQQHSVQIINDDAEELSFVKSITEQNFNILSQELKNKGFSVTRSLLKPQKGTTYNLMLMKS